MVILRAEEVAKRLKISKQTLVRYEKKGIFPKSRRNRINHWREYSEEDVKRMAHIMGRSGFTLVELIMVLVIVGILAGLTIPRMDSFYFIKFSGAMKKISADIRYVQQIALSRHADTRIDFYTGSESYRCCYCSAAGGVCSTGQCGSGSWVDIPDPFTRQSLWINFTTDPQFGGILIETVNFGMTASLMFDWQGIPKNAARVDLVDNGSVRFSYRNGTITNTVYVIPQTGNVRVQ